MRATETTVRLFRDHELVATHPRQFRPGGPSTIDEHLPPEAIVYKRRDPQWCLRQSEDIGAACHVLNERLFAHRVLDNLRAAQSVIGLARRFGTQRLEAPLPARTQPTARRRYPRPAPTGRLLPDSRGRELSLSPAHARASKTNRCHRRKNKEIINPVPDPRAAPVSGSIRAVNDSPRRQDACGPRRPTAPGRRGFPPESCT